MKFLKAYVCLGVPLSPLLGISMLATPAYAQFSPRYLSCSNHLTSHINSSSEFSSAVQGNLTGVGPIGNNTLGTLGLIQGCVDGYRTAIRMNKAMCPEASSFMQQVIRVRSSFPPGSGLSTPGFGDDIVRSCNSPELAATPAIAAPIPPVMVLPNITTPTSELEPTVSVTEDIASASTERENEDLDTTRTISARSRIDLDTPNKISSSDFNSAAWVNSGVFYTASNPSRLSSTVKFPVSKGMSAAVKTNGGVLNVRSNGGLNNPVIDTLQNFTSVRLSGLENDGWVQLNSSGWVHSDYITP